MDRKMKGSSAVLMLLIWLIWRDYIVLIWHRRKLTERKQEHR